MSLSDTKPAQLPLVGKSMTTCYDNGIISRTLDVRGITPAPCRKRAPHGDSPYEKSQPPPVHAPGVDHSLAWSVAAMAQDCNNGNALYHQQVTGIDISCSQGSCHGPTRRTTSTTSLTGGQPGPNQAGNIDAARSTVCRDVGLRTALGLTPATSTTSRCTSGTGRATIVSRRRAGADRQPDLALLRQRQRRLDQRLAVGHDHQHRRRQRPGAHQKQQQRSGISRLGHLHHRRLARRRRVVHADRFLLSPPPPVPTRRPTP